MYHRVQGFVQLSTRYGYKHPNTSCMIQKDLVCVVCVSVLYVKHRRIRNSLKLIHLSSCLCELCWFHSRVPEPSFVPRCEAHRRIISSRHFEGVNPRPLKKKSVCSLKKPSARYAVTRHHIPPPPKKGILQATSCHRS
jgi:hypothetical protein